MFLFLCSSSLLVEDFVRQFPGRSLPVELAEFSFPTQLRESQNVLQQQEKQVSINNRKTTGKQKVLKFCFKALICQRYVKAILT